VGLGDFFKDVGNATAHGLRTAVNTVNHLDPFHDIHYDSSSSAAPEISDRPLAGPIGNPINHQVETVSRGLNWVRNNGVSQPLSTALMAGTLPGGPFKASNWSQAWHAAEHISPGQALFLGSNAYGQDPNGLSSTEKAVNSPLLYYKPGSAQLPPGFDQLSEAQQQKILKDAGMPAVGNAYIEELRKSSSFYKNATGVGDFALAWWADPTIIAGRTAGELRRSSQVARRPAAGWSATDIDQLMEKSTMGKAQDFIWQNKDNPQLLNNLAMAKNSALGPRFGAIASLLKSPMEVHNFLRVGLGDIEAIESLQTQNVLAASRIEQDTSRLSALDLLHTRYANVGNGRMTAIVREQMDNLNTRINADEGLVSRYSQVLDHAHELDQINLSRWSFAKARDVTDAQNAYKARAARTGARHVQIQPTPFLSRGTSTPVDLGFTKSRIYGVGDFFSTPVTMVRSFANVRPNGYMRIDDIDKDSIAELRGQLARIPGIRNETRIKLLNDYLKTQTEGERTALLSDVGRIGAAKIAEKHGLDPDMGLELYQEHMKRQVGEIDNMKRYSAAKRPVTLEDGTLAHVNVDEFAADGGKLVVHPNLVTRLTNDHVFQDLGEMDKVLARHGSALSAIRTTTLGNPDWMLNASDWLTGIFKFGTLFRLGYIPRVAGDDLAGQVARLGAANMAMRVGWGVKNGITNAALWRTRPMEAAKASVAQQGVDYASREMAAVRAEMEPIRAQIAGRRAAVRADLTAAGRRLTTARAKRAAMDASTPPVKVAAMDQLIAKHELALQRASRSMSTGVGAKSIKLRDLEAHHGFLDTYRGLQQKVVDESTAAAKAPKVIQGSQPVALGRGVQAPAAFAGKEGEYYQKLVSGDEAMGQVFARNKQLVHGHLMRSFDHGGKVMTAANDETLHAVSWAHAINGQLVQDQLAVLAVKGASPEDMTKWLTRTAEGRAYRRRIGLKMTPAEDLANAAWHDVAEYMPTPEIRLKALEPDGVTPQFLKDSMPMAHRPDVHTGQVGAAQSKYLRAMDGVMGAWYKFAATTPANRLSRHPLFNQLYEGHLTSLKNTLVKQSAYDTTVEGVEKMATTARRLALRDMRKLVFDIAHRSDAAAALRFISPFMSATNESFQRWGRILADKPQVVGYANDFFNAPIARGSMQDADGNHVAKDGYSYTMTYPLQTDGTPDYSKGKAVKRLVPKSERYIVGRMPAWLAKSPVGVAFGVEPSSGNFKLSQNSMDLVTQGDPWFHPGVGPIVQIPVNALVKDKPKAAEMARHLGVLPFGPQNGGPFGSGPAGEAASFFLPSTVKNFLTAYDTSDERYQSVKLQIMQRAAYEHSELGKPMPSAKQIADQVRNYWLFSASSAFLQPMATQKADKYQFFRDQYNALRRADPLTADDQFLQRYGESYFIFAQSQSKNNSGIPATAKAVALSRKYGDLIAANPELGALIVGPEGEGPFSPEAYSYQLNTPVAPGGAEMQRSKMSANEAMTENQKRLGWSKFTAMVNRLTADLHNRGLKSFADKGAEDLKAQKAAYVQLYSQPLMPDGTPNQYYNAAWSEDYSTLDSLKYERLIPGLTKVANSDLATHDDRSDLRTLQDYLSNRQGMLQQLQERAAGGGSKTLTAKSNSDLATQWSYFVDGLIESDTRFGDLHSRYLARDLGVDTDQEMTV
jgi:hypothetical protein